MVENCFCGGEEEFRDICSKCTKWKQKFLREQYLHGYNDAINQVINALKQFNMRMELVKENIIVTAIKLPFLGEKRNG